MNPEGRHVPPPLKAKVRRGFTLAELLIALGILGVIAAFTIPKVLQAQADEAIRARLKADVGYFSGLMYELSANSQFTDDYNAMVTYQNVILAKINYTYACGSSFGYPSASHPCMPYPPCGPATNCHDWRYAVLLHDGSSVAFASSGVTQPAYRNYVLVDGNGPNPPNKIGQDRLVITVNRGGVSGKVECGTAIYDDGGSVIHDAENKALWDTLFSH